MREINLNDKLFIHFGLPTKFQQTVQIFLVDAELMCKKIVVCPSVNIRYLYDKTNKLCGSELYEATGRFSHFRHSGYKLELEDLVLKSTHIEEKIDHLCLGSIKSIFSPFGKKLLVTVLFNNNYYEYICDAIVTNEFDSRFNLVSVEQNHPLICYECDSKTIKKMSEAFHPDYYMNNPYLTILGIACTNVHRQSGPAEDNLDLIYSCHIHSIEVLRDAKYEPITIVSHLRPKYQIPSFKDSVPINSYSEYTEKLRSQTFIRKDIPFFTPIEVIYHIDNRILCFYGKTERKYWHRNSNGTEERVETTFYEHYKIFRTQYEMKKFILGLENKYIQYNLIISEKKVTEKDMLPLSVINICFLRDETSTTSISYTIKSENFEDFRQFCNEFEIQFVKTVETW